MASRRRSPAISRSISAFRLSELASKRREHFDFDYEVPSFGDTRERRFNLAFNLESFTTRAGVCGGLDDITTKLPYIKSTIVQSNGEVMKEPNGRPKRIIPFGQLGIGRMLWRDVGLPFAVCTRCKLSLDRPAASS